MKKDKLTKKEYEEILKYYKKSIPKDLDKNKIKELAEDLVAQKLCSCIKSVNKEKHKDGEKRSIGICKSSILLNKGFSDKGFRCKNGRPKITLKKYNDKTFGCWRNKTKKNKTSRKSKK